MAVQGELRWGLVGFLGQRDLCGTVKLGSALNNVGRSVLVYPSLDLFDKSCGLGNARYIFFVIE